jgi:hypothetical protein
LPATQFKNGVLAEVERVCTAFSFQEHAMKTFLSRFHALVCFVLSGFDRLRFCGESRLLNHVGGVNSYLYQNRILRRDFPEHCEKLTRRLRQESYKQAEREGVPLKHLDSAKLEKDVIALELARTHKRNDGRIALLTCLEPGMTYRLRQTEDGFVEPRKETTRCLHLYHYFLHDRFGLCYVRVQTWFPFTIRIGINGRLWLARELKKHNVPFQRHRNLITAVDDPALAQQLLDDQTRADWPVLLAELVQPIQPLWSFLYDHVRTPYYWMTEQSEWTTDFVFRSAADLAAWYPRWVRHGLETLQCRDVLRYMGKKNPDQCPGEVQIDLRTRNEGSRLKFHYDSNSGKYYNKEGNDQTPIALRLENTFNKVNHFKVFRVKEGEDPAAPKSWQQMRKGVADLPRRAEIGQAINNRLAESLATVAEPNPLGELLKPLGQPIFKDGKRRARALNPLTGNDGELLRALGNGDFLLQGFRNRDLRIALHGDTADAAECRKQSAAITRRLALLHAHGLIVKVPKSHRYHLSAQGKRIITALLAAHAANVTQLTTAA